MNQMKSYSQKGQAEYQKLEYLTERGRQMHSRAVYALFAGAVSRILRFALNPGLAKRSDSRIKDTPLIQ